MVERAEKRAMVVLIIVMVLGLFLVSSSGQ